MTVGIARNPLVEGVDGGNLHQAVKIGYPIDRVKFMERREVCGDHGGN